VSDVRRQDRVITTLEILGEQEPSPCRSLLNLSQSGHDHSPCRLTTPSREGRGGKDSASNGSLSNSRNFCHDGSRTNPCRPILISSSSPNMSLACSSITGPVAQCKTPRVSSNTPRRPARGGRVATPHRSSANSSRAASDAQDASRQGPSPDSHTSNRPTGISKKSSFCVKSRFCGFSKAVELSFFSCALLSVGVV
jgi:hypothetical protein